jgi:hypothetical protein
VTRTFETSKVKRVVVCRSGSRSLEAGLHPNSSMALFHSNVLVNKITASCPDCVGSEWLHMVSGVMAYDA